MGDILEDTRFTKYLNDPRYRQIPKSERKVRIDKRFQSMFKDDKFKVKYTVDKRGRPVNETSTENLRKYYDLPSSEESEDSETIESNNELQARDEKSSEKVEAQAGKFVRRPSTDEEANRKDLQSKNDKLQRGKLGTKVRNRLLDLDIDYARGEGVLVTDSSSDEDSSQEEEETDVEHEWGELDADAETTDEATNRIAVCNLDWDNIKAADIMVLLNSFLPPGGIIYKVTIYPSEFGLKRMQEEEIKGPLELTEKKLEMQSNSEEEGNEEGSTYHMEKLRRYQLNRLKYFYAVVECDSVATADKLYSECDGMEYESSATKLDLRFIPAEVDFEQEPREVCTKLPDLSRYKPRLFTTTALQQAKVELTWDATNPNRTEAIKSALDGKIDDLDLKDYLASSSDDGSENEEETISIEQAADGKDGDDVDAIQKYKNLLKEIHDKEEKKSKKDVELEISWGLGVKEKAEELVKRKIDKDDKQLTPFEKIIQKRREKKKQKKLQKKQANEGPIEEVNEYSSDDIPSDVDMNDPYFKEEFEKPEFKKKDKRVKSRHDEEIDEEEEKRKAELELLLDDDDGKAHFSLRKIQESECNDKKSKKKRKFKNKMKESKETQPEFEVNVNDERFSALFNSHLYNIDPTDPNFKKTKNMEKLIHEKLKRRPQDTPMDETAPKKSKEDAKLSLLVKNIKRKTKQSMS